MCHSRRSQNILNLYLNRIFKMHTVLVITLFSTIICIKHIIAQVIVKQ